MIRVRPGSGTHESEQIDYVRCSQWPPRQPHWSVMAEYGRGKGVPVDYQLKSDGGGGCDVLTEVLGLIRMVVYR